MCRRAFLTASVIRVLITLLLVSLLTGCGGSSINNPTVASSLGATTKGGDPTSLHIQPEHAFGCPWLPSYVGTPNDLALATSRLTYTVDELQQMRAYWGGGGPLPKTLRWVLGGPQCGGIWEITNTSNATIQIPRVTMRLKKIPQVNTYQYHLVDVCTLIPPPDCFGSRGNGPGACSPYYAIFYLQAGKIDDTFAATPISPECGELTLDPNDTIELLFMFYPASGSPNNLIYTVVPELVLNISTVQNTLTLSQLISTLTFAAANQLSCYGLQDTTFVIENPSPPPDSKVHFCINQYVNYMPH